jgi:uncharacterized membrane protein
MMSAVSFWLLVLAAGLGGYAVTARLGLADDEAWVAGRIGGLILVALPAWWFSVLGLSWWRQLGLALLLITGAIGLVTLWQRRSAWQRLLTAEAIIITGFVLLLLLRLTRPEIRGQEKPMDLGILATLLRTESMPPPDMWLAGESLPYYYFGALLWVVPLAASGLAIEVGYNLVVALVAGLVLAATWMLGKALGGGCQWAGAVAGFFAVLAGSPDGLRQLIARGSLDQIEIWQSSRQVVDTITEMPLFTAWLGDLHPHYLSMAPACLAMLLALHLGRKLNPFPFPSPTRWAGIAGLPGLAALTAVIGVTWAANPWALPPTLTAAALLILSGDGRWHWDRQRWLVLPAVAAGAWLVTAPFHLAFDPPFFGLAPVHAWTPPHQLLLYAGCFLIPVAWATVARLGSWLAGGSTNLRPIALALTILALVLLGSLVSHRLALLLVVLLWVIAGCALLLGGDEDNRTPLLIVVGVQVAVLLALVAAAESLTLPARPTLLLLLLPLAVMTAAGLGKGHDPDRPGLALAALGLFLLMAPEVIYVVDTYGEQLHRMNTVFKSYIQAWILLAVALPVLLPRQRRARIVMIGLLLIAALPHLLGLARATVSGAPPGLDGLSWMAAADRAIVEHLRQLPDGVTLVEAVGEAYSEHGRLSVASGVPAFLGWGNHETVWRGVAFTPEVERRRQLVEALYTAADAQEVRRLMAEIGTDLVAIGSLERLAYPSHGLAAIAAAGEVVLDEEGGMLVRFPRGPEQDREDR